MNLDDCPVKTAIDVIGGKWKPLILYSLKEGALRFAELRRRVPGASQKVVTQQIRQLEIDGVVTRRASPGSLPHAEYRLSDYGETLRPVLDALANWGMQHKGRHSGSTPL